MCICRGHAVQAHWSIHHGLPQHASPSTGGAAGSAPLVAVLQAAVGDAETVVAPRVARGLGLGARAAGVAGATAVGRALVHDCDAGKGGGCASTGLHCGASDTRGQADARLVLPLLHVHGFWSRERRSAVAEALHSNGRREVGLSAEGGLGERHAHIPTQCSPAHLTTSARRQRATKERMAEGALQRRKAGQLSQAVARYLAGCPRLLGRMINISLQPDTQKFGARAAKPGQELRSGLRGRLPASTGAVRTAQQTSSAALPQPSDQ